MKYIADFHIHSHYSLATSKELVPEFLDYWARIKGIKVVGTGDFTHPSWIKELKEKLEPAEQGLYKLKKEFKKDIPFIKPNSTDDEVRFILTAEISSIYKKNGKTRKVHNIILAPGFEEVDKIQNKLLKLGFNITSDGRPILGMDCKDLLKLVLDVSDKNFFIPAHIWTPWFSVLGDKSGFDTVEECFEEMSEHIYAVETGLSSNQPMNWMCGFLDKYTLISNSDAHSPEKLGRNANMFDTGVSYDEIINALKTGKGFEGTIDMFPQEGKYHYAGHRKCNVCWDPVETIKHDEMCPVCGKPIVVGVMNRVVELSDREDVLERPNRHAFFQVISLKEILSEINKTAVSSKKVTAAYNQVLQKAGTEFDILLKMNIEEIRKSCGDILAEAIRRMRAGEIHISEGYDGEYGSIKVFGEKEDLNAIKQNIIFDESKSRDEQKPKRKLLNFDLKEYHALAKQKGKQKKVEEPQPSYSSKKKADHLNEEQKKAVEHFNGPALVIAGPGSGKTKTLTQRIARLINEKNIKPENILAVTFTNKAAEEMRERLNILITDKKISQQLNVLTFHALGSILLKENAEKTGRKSNFTIFDEEDKLQMINDIFDDDKQKIKMISAAITDLKQGLVRQNEIQDKEIADRFSRYNEYLQKQNAFDFDDLIFQTVNLLTDHAEILEKYRTKFKWLMIDEYQDVNFAQYKLVRLLMAEPNSNIYVIGDPNQAIYGFRGADVKYIQRFMDDYPQAEVYHFKKSYRCSDLILKASGDVIQTDDTETVFLKGVQKGVKIKIVPQETDKSEAEYIARSIEQLMGGLRFYSMDSKVVDNSHSGEIDSLSDIVVLCRIGRQMDAIEKALKDHSIPYQKIGEVPFFKKKPVKDLIDLLKLIYNPDNYYLESNLIHAKIIYVDEISKIKNFVKNMSVLHTIQYLADTYFEKEQEENESVFKHLMEMAMDYGNDADGFLCMTALGTGVDTFKPTIENVTVMTLHASKGLEFECVFIAGCENGLLPYSLFENKIADQDEERRLLYVGMTRAKKYLYLTHANKRHLFGKEYSLERSEFIDKIEKELIDVSKNEYKKKSKKDDLQLDLFN